MAVEKRNPVVLPNGQEISVELRSNPMVGSGNYWTVHVTMPDGTSIPVSRIDRYESARATAAFDAASQTLFFIVGNLFRIAQQQAAVVPVRQQEEIIDSQHRDGDVYNLIRRNYNGSIRVECQSGNSGKKYALTVVSGALKCGCPGFINHGYCRHAGNVNALANSLPVWKAYLR